MKNLTTNQIGKIIITALKEDIGTGDLTTNSIISKKQKGDAYFLVKEGGVIAGLKVAKAVFKKLDENIKWKFLLKDGDYAASGVKIAEVSGSLRALLTGERTALNFIQRMSGIASLTNKFVEAVKGTGVKILDTRKTAPGLRLLDKYAVMCGGGTNHRFGLYDMVLIKDNHIKAAGSITKAVVKVKSKIPDEIKIEVETTSLLEVEEALECGVDVIMLDNMDIEEMKEAVKLVGRKCLVEASGKINLENIRAVAETGVDLISIGALTHSIKALDIRMEIENR